MLNLVTDRRHIALTAAVLAAILLPTRSAEAVTLFVSPMGNDHWTGRSAVVTRDRRDGPLRSLAGARDAVRRLKHRPTTPVFVEFEAGTYEVEGPVVFGPEDSGSPRAPITYEAARGATAVISGGEHLAFVEDHAGRWIGARRTLPPSVIEKVFVDGRRVRSGRLPESGYYFVQSKAPESVVAPSGETVKLGNRAFVARPEDIAALRSLTPEQLVQVIVVVYQSWTTSRHHIAWIDPRSPVVVLETAAAWPFEYWGHGQRYIIENLPGPPSRPGLFAATEGSIVYWPHSNETIGVTEVVVPRAQGLIRIQGSHEKPVTNLRFRRLAFRYSRSDIIPEAYADNQAASRVGGAISIDQAREIAVEDCEISHVEGYGIWFRTGCVECVLRRSLVFDLGAGGVRIGNLANNPPLDETSHVIIDNNIISDGGNVFPAGVGVWIGEASFATVSHNAIAEFDYTGISVGWHWGFGESHTHDNQIVSNTICDIGRGVLSDLGGIYTLGVSPGTVIDSNVIHAVESYNRYGRGGWGIYNDEGSSDITVTHNLVYDTTNGGYHLNYGRRITIASNVFAFGTEGQLQLSHPDSGSVRFVSNVVQWDRGPIFVGDWSKGSDSAGNIYYGGPISEAERAIVATLHSTIEDPGFVDAQVRDFRLLPSAAAARLGLSIPSKPAPGIYGDAAWRARAPACAVLPSARQSDSK